MPYRLLYLPGAAKDIRALPGAVAARVRKAVERLGEDLVGKPWWESSPPSGPTGWATTGSCTNSR